MRTVEARVTFMAHWSICYHHYQKLSQRRVATIMDKSVICCLVSISLLSFQLGCWCFWLFDHEQLVFLVDLTLHCSSRSTRSWWLLERFHTASDDKELWFPWHWCFMIGILSWQQCTGLLFCSQKNVIRDDMQLMKKDVRTTIYFGRSDNDSRTHLRMQ